MSRLTHELLDTARRVRHRADWRLYRKYHDKTMAPEWRFIDNLTLVRHVTAVGDLVECGTWRGGMSAAMAEALPGHRSVLFDSFEGLPEFTDKDSNAVLHEFAKGDRFAVGEEVACGAMQRTGENFEIRKGWFEETVPKFAAEQPTIAVLRLDADLYDSTMVCLTHLFPLVAPGGLILIDDYGSEWDGCTRAVHDYLSREARTEAIRSTRCQVAHLWHH
jgi:O-methyltransferase